MKHEDNEVSQVAYLQYDELGLEEKPPADVARDKEFLESLIKSSAVAPT